MLLDTHVLLWLDAADRRLGPATRDRLQRTGTEAFFSPISVAELEIKQLLGRVEFDADLPERLRRAGLGELPLTTAQVHAVVGFPSLVRHDPFDRLLLAQAATETMPFLTADRVLLALGEEWILDARA